MLSIIRNVAAAEDNRSERIGGSTTAEGCALSRYRVGSHSGVYTASQQEETSVTQIRAACYAPEIRPARMGRLERDISHTSQRTQRRDGDTRSVLESLPPIS